MCCMSSEPGTSAMAAEIKWFKSRLLLGTPCCSKRRNPQIALKDRPRCSHEATCHHRHQCRMTRKATRRPSRSRRSLRTGRHPRKPSGRPQSTRKCRCWAMEMARVAMEWEMVLVLVVLVRGTAPFRSSRIHHNRRLEERPQQTSSSTLGCREPRKIQRNQRCSSTSHSTPPHSMSGQRCSSGSSHRCSFQVEAYTALLVLARGWGWDWGWVMAEDQSTSAEMVPEPQTPRSSSWRCGSAIHPSLLAHLRRSLQAPRNQSTGLSRSPHPCFRKWTSRCPSRCHWLVGPRSPH